MNRVPAREKLEPSVDDDPQGPAQIGVAQADAGEQPRLAARGAEIDLSLPIAEDVDMSRQVIVHDGSPP